MEKPILYDLINSKTLKKEAEVSREDLLKMEPEQLRGFIRAQEMMDRFWMGRNDEK